MSSGLKNSISPLASLGHCASLLKRSLFDIRRPTSRCRPTSGACGPRLNLQVTLAPLAAERQAVGRRRLSESRAAEVPQFYRNAQTPGATIEGVEDSQESGDLLFEVPTPIGFRVRATRAYWEMIICIKHPVMVGLEREVRATLENPEEIRQSRIDPNVYLFYRSEDAAVGFAR